MKLSHYSLYTHDIQAFGITASLKALLRGTPARDAMQRGKQMQGNVAKRTHNNSARSPHWDLDEQQRQNPV